MVGTGGDHTADTKQIVFSSAEEMYVDIRGLNFNAVGPTLSRKVCEVLKGTGTRDWNDLK